MQEERPFDAAVVAGHGRCKDFVAAPVSAISGAAFFHTFWDIMNGCSNSIGSPEPRCIGARSVMLPDTKGDTGGTASASATVCPRDRQHGQRQRYPRRCQAAVVGEFEAAAVAHPDEGRCGVPAGDAGRRRPTRRRAPPGAVPRSPSHAGGTPRYLASAGGDIKGRNGVAVPVVVMAGEGIRQTTQVGASTTSWPPTDWGRGPTPRGWSGPRPMRCAGPTMLRRPSNIGEWEIG